MMEALDMLSFYHECACWRLFNPGAARGILQQKMNKTNK